MNKTRGRRYGSPDTRGEILAAAQDLFSERGYTRTTLREVASKAGVDAALVSYFFGSKHGLFAESLTLTVGPGEVIRRVAGGGRAQLAERAVDEIMRAWQEPQDVEPLRRLIASLLDNPQGVPTMGEFIEREVLGPLSEALGSDDAARDQAAVVTMLIGGVVITRQLMGIEVLAAVPDETVKRLVAAAVDTVIARPGR